MVKMLFSLSSTLDMLFAHLRFGAAELNQGARHSYVFCLSVISAVQMPVQGKQSDGFKPRL